MDRISSRGDDRPFGRVRVRWPGLAVSGQVLWLCGNLYESIVDVPRLLRDAQPRRRPGLLKPGSPLRYYAPTAPLALAATAATLMNGWRSGGNKRVIGTAAAHMAVAVGLTAYLVRKVNVPLLTGTGSIDDAEQQRMLRIWRRVNAVRVAAVVGALVATRRLNEPRRPSSTSPA